MSQNYLIGALESLEEEAQKSGVLKAVHGILEKYLYELDDTLLQPIAEKNKTYAGAMKEMEAVARKRKNGNMAVIPPDEAEKIIKAYFGINSEKAENSGGNSGTVSIFDL